MARNRSDLFPMPATSRPLPSSYSGVFQAGRNSRKTLSFQTLLGCSNTPDLLGPIVQYMLARRMNTTKRSYANRNV
jgi:hypothetical protein